MTGSPSFGENELRPVRPFSGGIAAGRRIRRPRRRADGIILPGRLKKTLHIETEFVKFFRFLNHTPPDRMPGAFRKSASGRKGAVEKPTRREKTSMAYVTMKELLEAGVHFGHQTKRWNPKMKPYIFGARNGIYIIDLQKTVRMFRTAYDFVRDTVANGQAVLFVGTKKQARDAIYEEANRCEMFYVYNRWLGGMMTNFQTIKQSIDRLNHLNEILNDEEMSGLYTKKERLRLGKERLKLDNNLGGIRSMSRLPGALFIIDPKNEAIAVREAKRLGIPTVAIVDTNCDPDEIDYVIPGNDDAIRAIRLVTSKMADACMEGRELLSEKQLAKAEEAEEDLSEVAVASQELKPGERKVISDGTDGPVVEIIKRTAGESAEGEEETIEAENDAADTGE
jgi:small subunit ribosomal protein S2